MTLENIPFYMHWMSYVAYTRYGFEGTMLAIYGYDRDTLSCSQVCSQTKTRNFYNHEISFNSASLPSSLMAPRSWALLWHSELRVGRGEPVNKKGGSRHLYSSSELSLSLQITSDICVGWRKISSSSSCRNLDLNMIFDLNLTSVHWEH